VRTRFDRDLESFMQAYGSKRLDAGLLLIPLVGFLPATDPRMRNTVRAIEGRLLVEDEFVLRYERANPSDGLPPGEGAFLACSFWLVDNYILEGRHLEARKLFDRFFRVAMTWDCSPRNTIPLVAACWVIFRKPIAMWV
jgi:GH15 family glucan-1,4-alpha-glucosidase